MIFIKLYSNVNLSYTMSRTHDLATQTQGKGHSLRSWDLPLDFVSVPYLLNPLDDFHYSNVPLSKLVCRTQLCKVKVTLQGHGILQRGIWLSFRLLSCSIAYLNYQQLKCQFSSKCRELERLV